MAKLSKEEFKAKIDTLPIDEEVKIELLEDVEDSMEIVEEQPNVRKKAGRPKKEVKK